MIRFVDEHKNRFGVKPIIGELRGGNQDRSVPASPAAAHALR